MRCKKCNAKWDGKSSFCGNCGNDFIAEIANDTIKGDVRYVFKKANKVFNIIISLLIVLLIAFDVFLIAIFAEIKTGIETAVNSWNEIWSIDNTKISEDNNSSTKTPTPSHSDNVNTIPTDETIEIVDPHYGCVTIDGAEIIKDYDGKDCLLVKYTWTNVTDETLSAWSDVIVTGYQNGIEMDVAMVSSETYGTGDCMTNVRPGVTMELTWALTMTDYSPIEIEIGGYFVGEVYATQIFDPTELE